MPNLLRNSILYLLLAGCSAAFLLPVAWLLSSSVQPLQDMFVQPFRWIPSTFQLVNYTRAVTLFPFDRFLLNTIIVTVPSVLGTVASCSLVAYGFSRLTFRGRDALFAVCLATMMLPGQVTMIPLYMTFARLGWIDTYLPLVVPCFFGSPFYIFLLRQFFLTIPKEHTEAALMDGAGHLRIFWSVILPQARPALATVIIFAFIGSWNDFFGPLVYLNSPERATLTLGLHMMKSQVMGSGIVEWNVLMAASLIIMLPNILVFFFAQKQFLKGIQLGSFRL